MKCRYCDFSLDEEKGLSQEINKCRLMGHWKKYHPVEYKEFRKFMGRSYEFTKKKIKNDHQMNEGCR